MNVRGAPQPVAYCPEHGLWEADPAPGRIFTQDVSKSLTRSAYYALADFGRAVGWPCDHPSPMWDTWQISRVGPAAFLARPPDLQP
jgi:hypothetical protein